MNVNFDKQTGLVPVVVQDAATRDVLMLAYMNSEALVLTQSTNLATFYSRSRQCLWTKGATSGNILRVVSMVTDCDGDTLLLRVLPEGPTCHTGADTCFGARLPMQPWHTLSEIESVVHERRDHPQNGSYTSELFQKGINAIAQKVGEEAVELIIEAKDNNPQLFLNEAADLLFHTILLLSAKGHRLACVAEVLQQRRKNSVSDQSAQTLRHL